MKSKSPVAVSIIASLFDWLREEVGKGDPLAEKRAAWVEWRANRVTSFVQKLYQIAKQQRPGLTISSSGGPSPSEYYSCYRDAGTWLTSGINDHVFPMNYTEDLSELEEILRIQTQSAPKGAKQSIFRDFEHTRCDKWKDNVKYCLSMQRS